MDSLRIFKLVNPSPINDELTCDLSHHDYLA